MTNWQTEALGMLSGVSLTAAELSAGLSMADHRVGLFELHKWLEEQAKAGAISKSGRPTRYYKSFKGAA